MKMLLLHPRTVFGSITALALVLMAPAPALAAHPEGGAASSGLPHPPHVLPRARNPLHVLAPWIVPNTSGVGYRSALWEPASPQNYTVASRPFDLPIKRIVIHVAEGGFQSTYEWFKNPAARASAHYVVGSQGQVAQMVPERDIAWHAGNWAYNETSIWIEHAGYTNVTHFPFAEYGGSAKLAAYLADKYMVVPDRSHVIGHYQVPDPFHPGEFGGADHHTDPGHTWNWPLYMAYLRLDAVDTYQQPTDNTTPGGVTYSHSVWKPSSRLPQHTGPDYLTTGGRTPGHPVGYRFNVPYTDSYDIFMRWPCDRYYNRDVTVGVATASSYRSTSVDESRHCTRWNWLGSFTLAAGEGTKVVVLSSSHHRGEIVADAIRIVESSDPSPPTVPVASVTSDATSMRVSWTASSDNIAVAAYQLWVGGTLVYRGPNRSATVVGLDCGTAYAVSVRAVDKAGNRSAKHAQIVPTLDCLHAPTGLTAGGQTKTSIQFSWDAGGNTTTGYNVYLNGPQAAQTTAPSYTYRGLTCGTTYKLGVAAYDASGKVSAHSHIYAQTAAC
ncbi:MAG: N-acetylmuramoyl-L-alanine amidase [Gaiellales bacterium]